MFRGRFLAALLGVFLMTTFTLCNIGIEAALPVSAAVGFMLLSAIAASGLIKNKKALKNIIFALAVIILSAAHYTLFYFLNERPINRYLLAEYHNREVPIKAKIVEVTTGKFYTRFDLRLKEVEGRAIKYNFKLDLTIYTPIDDAAIDDIIETAVIFKEIEAGDAMYNKSNGYFIAAEVVENVELEDGGDGESSHSFKIIPAESHGVFYYLDKIQNRSWEIFRNNIRGRVNKQNSITQEAAFVYGVFIGRTEFMEKRVKTDFSRTGIAHVFSVSGLHMSIIMGGIYSFLRRLGIHKKLVCVVVIIVSLVFMAFTGFTVSVVRSGIMIMLYYIAFLGGRKSDSVTSLMAAGFLICAVAPYNSINLSFQLSFLATLGIVVTTGLNNKVVSKIPLISISLLPGDKNKGETGENSKNRDKYKSKPKDRLRSIKNSGRRSLRGIVSAILVTLFATLFTLPLTSYRFQTLSLISPIVNLLTSPLATAILLLSLLMLLLAFIPLVPFILGMILYFLSKLFLGITSFFASVKYACISVSGTDGDMFPLLSLILLVLCVLYFIIYSRRKTVKIIIASLISVCAVFMLLNLVYLRYAAKDSFRIAYYSDYKNQALILFQDDYEKADVIDITHGVSSPVLEIYRTALDNGAIDIGSFVLTHYHKRHVQMIEKFLDYCTIDRVFVPEPQTDYEKEVFQMLFDVSVDTGSAYVRSYELFMYDDGILDMGGTTVIVNTFSHNGVQHMTTDIRHDEENFLYLGIGYGDAYKYIDNIYDIVFYGTHKHNRKDEDFSTDIYGKYYGVLSDYINGFGNKATQRLEQNALEAYDTNGQSLLILCSEKDMYYPVFKISAGLEAATDRVKYFPREKPF